MKRALIAFLALMLGAGTSVAETNVPRFKGMAIISSELSARIATREEPFELDQFIPADGLDELAGTWSSFGTEHHFTNGEPNPVNMVILYASLSGFAEAMGKSCAEPQISLNDSFADTLEQICDWPNADAKSEPAMMEFWLGLMGYDAPKEEFLAWRDYFLSPRYRDRPASEVIAAMTLAIAMNPYFLVQK
jgi:hypothetical protein